MQSREIPTENSTTQASTASKPGRTRKLPMYGDVLQCVWKLATEQAQRRISSGLRPLRRHRGGAQLG